MRRGRKKSRLSRFRRALREAGRLRFAGSGGKRGAEYPAVARASYYNCDNVIALNPPSFMKAVTFDLIPATI